MNEEEYPEQVYVFPELAQKNTVRDDFPGSVEKISKSIKNDSYISLWRFVSSSDNNINIIEKSSENNQDPDNSKDIEGNPKNIIEVTSENLSNIKIKKTNFFGNSNFSKMSIARPSIIKK